jgi:hypothetical protein
MTGPATASTATTARTALIGYTGFVGSNLLASHPFTDCYNTANIHELRGRSYDLVVSAGGRADSHRINAHAEADRAELAEYLDVLSTVATSRLVHVSTVCVYPGGTTPSESTPLDPAGLTPYGVNRLHLEQELAARLPTLTLRLPQLYGAGLKKGIVHDLLADHRVEHIRPTGRFQYYDVRDLWGHVQTALAAGLTSLNLATPALASARVASDCFGVDISAQVVPGEESPFAQMYTRDMRTDHADLFGGPPGYLVDEKTEVERLRLFVQQVRSAAARPGPGTSSAPA